MLPLECHLEKTLLGEPGLLSGTRGVIFGPEIQVFFLPQREKEPARTKPNLELGNLGSLCGFYFWVL